MTEFNTIFGRNGLLDVNHPRWGVHVQLYDADRVRGELILSGPSVFGIGSVWPDDELTKAA